MASSNDVYAYLVAYIDKTGGAYSNWYAGIATDVKQRLFTEHNVSQSGRWAYITADTVDAARSVEKSLLQLGCDGGTGGGDSPKTVYVYLKSNETRE